MKGMFTLDDVRDAAERFHEKYVEADDGCWLWTASTTHGYGNFSLRGKNVRAHRYSWTLENEEFPGEDFICHTCDTKRCVNPDHLYAGDVNDNVQDAIERGQFDRKGESHHDAKLTAEDVCEIRSRMDEENTKLADEFGVSRSNISLVKSGETWPHVEFPEGFEYDIDEQKDRMGQTRVGEDHQGSKLSAEEVREIRSKDDMEETELAEEYGVHRATIGMIRRGETWTHID